MKVFVSWSGELSKKVAAELHEWLPLLMDNIEVFYSPEDIEKGENWNQRLSNELSSCNYGLVCLTPENLNSVWINFEAGSIAKAMDSRLAALLIGLNPSDLKGPISKYQATQITKDEFLQLILDMNKRFENPIDAQILEKRFNGLWAGFESKLQEIIRQYPSTTKAAKKPTERVGSDASEEILQLIRKQNSILSNPELLIPQEYLINILNERFDSFERAFSIEIKGRRNNSNTSILFRFYVELFEFFMSLVDYTEKYESVERKKVIIDTGLLDYLKKTLNQVDAIFANDEIDDRRRMELLSRFSFVYDRVQRILE